MAPARAARSAGGDCLTSDGALAQDPDNQDGGSSAQFARLGSEGTVRHDRSMSRFADASSRTNVARTAGMP
eukprot:4569859-Alexandrium_andersonii.AAC.1